LLEVQGRREKKYINRNLYTDELKKYGKIGCAVITLKSKIIRRLQSKNTFCNAEQEAILKASRVSKRVNEQRVIITYSLTTFMAVEANLYSQNPRTLIKLLHEEEEKSLYSGYLETYLEIIQWMKK
jgi:hypothetical protein